MRFQANESDMGQTPCIRTLLSDFDPLHAQVDDPAHLFAAADRELLFQLFGLSISVLGACARPRPPLSPSFAS